tara:strand:+ start:243 stop:458 length:216 start_codon:yes stop_codon:yes gene_type:complete
MKAGMIIRSKQLVSPPDNDRRWFIKKEGELKRQNNFGITIVKGYRVAPLEDLEHGFWVTEKQLHERFEEVV